MAAENHGVQCARAGATILCMKKTGLTFRADESAKSGVLRIADGLIDAALRVPRRTSRDAAQDVHFLRTTTKRLRALLQLIRPVIEGAAFERENARLKTAAFRLAPFRERAVAGETLKALGKSSAMLWQSGLADCVGKVRPAGSRRSAMRDAGRDLEQSRLGFHRLRIRGEGWAAFGPGLMKIYRQTRRRMKAAYAHPDDEAFHRWRIRVKQLDYLLQWLDPVWPKRFSKMRRNLHELEKKLGADHDLVVLRNLLDESPRDFDEVAIEQVKRAAAKRSRHLRRVSAPLGARALGVAPRRFRGACGRRWRAWVQRI